MSANSESSNSTPCPSGSPDAMSRRTADSQACANTSAPSFCALASSAVARCPSGPARECSSAAGSAKLSLSFGSALSEKARASLAHSRRSVGLAAG